MLDRRRVLPARNMLDSCGCKRIVAYLWRPRYSAYLDQIDYDLSCYHINDEYTFSPVERPLGEIEASLISKVDQVFVHSPGLLAKKGHINAHTSLVPNGVDYRSFSTPAKEPYDLRQIPRPRVGYVGYIKHDLDFELLLALAQRHRNWSFVFVGPKTHLNERSERLYESLASMANVYRLGEKPMDLLPGYIQHLDVCMLCYLVNAYTNCIYPLKLNEYLAAGRPVVGSPIRTLLDYQEVVRLARTTDDWSTALSESLREEANGSAAVEARRAVAYERDWETLVEKIARRICQRLGSSYIERFLRLTET